jgi:Cu-Zn family superoxide dismutase
MTIDAYDLPGDFVKPEGITMGPDGDFFSGSRTDGTIYRCGLADEVAEIWLPGGTDGRSIVLGFALYADAQLIVCGAETGTLYGYDLATRDLVSRRTVEGYLNDVWVIGDHAYATDSSQPVVWRFDLLDSAAAPEPISLKGTGPKVYPNGIVALDDSVLLVADPGEEVLLRVELDGSTQVLATEWAADGLLLLDDLLIGVCNRGDVLETAEFFLSALRLSPDGTAATRLGEHVDPRFDTPTTLAFDGDRLLVVNGQSAKGAAAAPPFQVIALPLPWQR